jgi:hypothetical protein
VDNQGIHPQPQITTLLFLEPKWDSNWTVLLTDTIEELEWAKLKLTLPTVQFLIILLAKKDLPTVKTLEMEDHP